MRTLVVVGLALAVGRVLAASDGSTSQLRKCATCQVEQNAIKQAPPENGSAGPVKAPGPVTSKPSPSPSASPQQKNDPPQPEAQSPQQPSSPTTNGPSEDERAFDDWLKNPKAGRGSTFGTGTCNCKDMPETAVSTALEYYNRHRARITGSDIDKENYHIAINDYSKTTGCMYIINLQRECVYALNADWGIGSNMGGTPAAKCESGSLGTPSGFHVTGPHTGGSGRYDSSNSLEMVDLQGQGSRGRGVLIHDGHGAGGAATWGCTGVSKSRLDEKPQDAKKTGFEIVKEQLPPRSLVYNYFPVDKQCNGHDVKNEMDRCEWPPGAPGPGGSGSGKAGGAVK